MSGGGRAPAAQSQELQLPPGFRFHPTDEELVMHYLCRRCAGLPISVPIIAEIDLYKYDPWQLPSTCRPPPLRAYSIQFVRSFLARLYLKP
jgi:hypothetical protein